MTLPASHLDPLDPLQVIELRQYTLHPGKRDALIELFDRAFVETQEAVGMRVLGQFRDLDAPDRFVWLRGFPDLASRAARLEAFYNGPVWQAHRDAANATMIDSDNVLLLRPLRPDTGFAVPTERGAAATGILAATIHLLRAPVGEAFLSLFQRRMLPILEATGARPIAQLATEYGKNEFPRLPVRDGEHAFVWFASFPTTADHAHHLAQLARALTADDAILSELERLCVSPPQVLRLSPTARSLLRHVDRRA